MKRNQITKNCFNCGKEITRPPSQFPGKKSFCSLKCKAKYYAQKERNPAWRGGKIVTSAGYIRIRKPGHPRAVGGYVLEHILIMENKIGRPLNPGECIHHIDGNRVNNDPENLKLYSSNDEHHKDAHPRKKHPPCRCGQPHKGHGLCARHLAQLRSTGKTWDFENNYLKPVKPGEKVGHRYITDRVCPCGKPARARGLCNVHYRRLLKNGKLPEFGIVLTP